MKEQIKQPENIITEEKIIKVFNEKGVNDQETRELLFQYIDKCHTQADAEAERNPDQSNVINIKTEVKIAELYYQISDKEYKEYALESLEQLFQNAGNNELPHELIERISSLINIWKYESQLR
jgi:hypothetical protein